MLDEPLLQLGEQLGMRRGIGGMMQIERMHEPAAEVLRPKSVGNVASEPYRFSSRQLFRQFQAATVSRQATLFRSRFDDVFFPFDLLSNVFSYKI